MWASTCDDSRCTSSDSVMFCGSGTHLEPRATSNQGSAACHGCARRQRGAAASHLVRQTSSLEAVPHSPGTATRRCRSSASVSGGRGRRDGCQGQCRAMRWQRRSRARCAEQWVRLLCGQGVCEGLYGTHGLSNLRATPTAHPRSLALAYPPPNRHRGCPSRCTERTMRCPNATPPRGASGLVALSPVPGLSVAIVRVRPPYDERLCCRTQQVAVNAGVSCLYRANQRDMVRGPPTPQPTRLCPSRHSPVGDHGSVGSGPEKRPSC